jgi:alginate O-acetyltransferase complex protein AlgI
MLFNSWTFAVFLVVTFVCYHFLPWPKGSRVFWQIGLLAVASYVFYAWHTPWLVVILAVSTWINARATLHLLDPRIAPSARRRWVITAVVANLGFLAFFKYASLLVETLLPGSWWAHWGFDLTQIPLPVGISFYTFQGISLVIDVYRSGPRGIEGVAPPSTPREVRHSVLKTAFFQAFFPQLVAGPIVKAHEFMYQIAAKRLSGIQWDLAVRNLIMGYFLKMVVADNLKEATAALDYPTFMGMPGINLLFLLYGYSFRIFADFAGYSLIAIGLARLFGYRLPVNFNFPYLSHSITEFWRRWHISLSTWLKEYLYFPLGGNRKGSVRTYVNLITVMLLGGLWHGAAWSYMVWGGAHGLFLAIERFFSRGCGIDLSSWRAGRFGWVVGALQIFATFNLVSFLWLLFQLPDFGEAVAYFRELLAWRPGFAPQAIYVILFFGAPVVFYHVWGHCRGRLMAATGRDPQAGRWAVDLAYAAMLVLILTNSGSPGEFIYFQF